MFRQNIANNVRYNLRMSKQKKFKKNFLNFICFYFCIFLGLMNAQMHSANWIGSPIKNINHILYVRNCKYIHASSVHTKTERITNLNTYLPQYVLNGYSTKHDAGMDQANIVHRLSPKINLP